MLDRQIKLGATSNILRVKLRKADTGQGITGLAYNTSGLIISTIADNEASATVYTSAATHVETISTLGTFAAPSASCCRFKELDATNHPGTYEIQIADARFAVASARVLRVSILGATNLLERELVIELVGYDPTDSVRAGLTALPNAAAEASGGLYTRGTGAGQINQAANGQIDANAVKVGGATPITEATIADATLDDPMTEPSAVPAWATMTPRKALAFLTALALGKQTLNKTTGAGVVRNASDSGTIGTRTDSDDGTTYTKGAWS